MNAITFGLILVGVLLGATGQLFLKAGTNRVGRFAFRRDNILPIGWKLATEPRIVAGLVCYVIGVAVWIVALSRVEVSIAYPMVSMGYVVNAVAAWYLFGEAVTRSRLVGIGIIAIGVYIVAQS
ncbi:MAG: EamA family transporter [Burkholderiales bacterium]|nr:EamA family transporter [Burkholderiales bacterium]